MALNGGSFEAQEATRANGGKNPRSDMSKTVHTPRSAMKTSANPNAKPGDVVRNGAIF